MFKCRVTIIFFMILLTTDLYCMMPTRRALQQIAVHTTLVRSVRALSSQGICDCSPQECKINQNPRMMCKRDVFLDDVIINNNDLNHHTVINNHTRPVIADVRSVMPDVDDVDFDLEIDCD